ncbi:MAG: S1 RNA-binding domain-containing protein [Candidatus Caenarcaniphilales bacterium]|nr:S1 RNA-binding domain-containing protein [Candidatus Caenarcaniphilales bacterium]
MSKQNSPTTVINVSSSLEVLDSSNTPFAELLASGNYDYYFERGQIVSGVVVSYQKDGVLVDVGAKSEAFVPSKEVADYASADPEEVLPTGQEFEFYILRDEAGSGFDGRIVLSFKRVAQARSWAALEDKRNTDAIFEAVIQEVVKGGVVVELDGLRGFIPASHLRVKGGSNNPKLVGQNIPCTILEIDKQQSKLILSQKIAISKLYAEEREKLLTELVAALKAQEESIAAGNDPTVVTVQGEVVRITDFGAFVKIGDTEIDGLLPLSEISWKRVTHPSEALKIGDQITAQVLNVVPEQCRISLSLKRLEKDPWESIQTKINEGDVIDGSINKVANFGVFVRIIFNDPELDECGFEALLPLDEIPSLEEESSEDVLEKFHVDQKIKALVRKIKPDERRVTLSTKYIDEKGNLIAPLPEDMTANESNKEDQEDQSEE